jgi:hypothetical protein
MHEQLCADSGPRPSTASLTQRTKRPMPTADSRRGLHGEDQYDVGVAPRIVAAVESH